MLLIVASRVSLFRSTPSTPIDPADAQRVGGWFLLTVGLLLAGTGWTASGIGSYVLAVMLSVGLWLVMRTASFIGIADSTAHLLEEEQLYRSLPSVARAMLPADARRRSGVLSAIIAALVIAFLAILYAASPAADHVVVLALSTALLILAASSWLF